MKKLRQNLGKLNRKIFFSLIVFNLAVHVLHNIFKMSMFGGSAKNPVMAKLNATIAQNQAENPSSSQSTPTSASNNSSELLRSNEVFILI
jgi:hypothetical protein